MAVSLSKCETAWAIRLHATVCDYVCERDGGGHCLNSVLCNCLRVYKKLSPSRCDRVPGGEPQRVQLGLWGFLDIGVAF